MHDVMRAARHNLWSRTDDLMSSSLHYITLHKIVFRVSKITKDR